MINWGIIGCGNIASKFAHELNLVKDCNLYAVASRSMDKAESFAQAHRADIAYGSYQSLVEDQNVDVVYVATPHPMHHPDSLLCIAHGKHVLCEKPLAMNGSEVKQMITAARENRVFFMEAMWTLLFPYMGKLKELIAEDVLGDIKMIEADFGFRADHDPNGRLFNNRLGGGALLDIGVYPLALCHHLLGKPDAVTALGQIGSTGVDESTSISLGWKNGAMASLHCTILADTKCVAKIFGSKAYIEIDSRWHRAKSMHLKDRNGLIESYQFADEFQGYAYEIQETNECIRNNNIESQIVSHQFSIELMETMDRIRKIINLSYSS